MKTAILGSRSLGNNKEAEEQFYNILDSMVPLTKRSTFVTENNNGPEKWAEIYAKYYGHSIIIHHATNGNTPYARGKGNGKGSNGILAIQDADNVIIFWDGCSKRTMNNISLAEKFEKQITVYVWEISGWKVLDLGINASKPEE